MRPVMSALMSTFFLGGFAAGGDGGRRVAAADLRRHSMLVGFALALQHENTSRTALPPTAFISGLECLLDPLG